MTCIRACEADRIKRCAKDLIVGALDRIEMAFGDARVARHVADRNAHRLARAPQGRAGKRLNPEIWRAAPRDDVRFSVRFTKHGHTNPPPQRNRYGSV
ncbi:hypothetical protein D9M73_179700 [compost metagenome]